jgi:uncharacterized RDD family membrane protein YckC
VKCPKCSYLGFETGDRCKNCGYDFSLIAVGPAAGAMPDVIIRTDDAETGAPELWLDRMDRSMAEADRPSAQDQLAGIPTAAPSPAGDTPDRSLPLFNPEDPDDIPLIALPVAPRPPLSVRRTPEGPRLRAVPRVARRAEPALNFREEPDEDEDAPPLPVTVQPSPRRSAPVVEGRHDVGFRRLAAAAIDQAMLLAIDVAVIYFTLRIAGLDAADVEALPLAPLVAFLALVKLAYFTSFTAVGGQTIGKMALRIRVIGDRVELDGGRAIRRTCASILSILPLGLGFLPALLGEDRRALHDRLTHTRVVGLPSA